MSEDQAVNHDLPDQLSDILLVLNRKKMKIEAVTGIDEEGRLKTVSPDKANQNQFLKVDRNGNLFSNFFSNFINQLKNPTDFNFFKVSVETAPESAKQLQKHIDHPTEKGKKFMEKVQIDPDEHHSSNQKVTDMDNKQNTPEKNEYRYTPEQIDWETMSNLGLSRERLEKKNLLEPLLKGYKTNELVSINLNLGTAITRLDARLSLQPGENGMATVAIHGIREKPQLDFPFLGHEFSKEDKENLLKIGNMGRAVELTNPKNGEKIQSLISVDRLTNELVAVGVEKIKIPDEIKGIKLDEQQKQTLLNGKPLYLEGMTSAKNELFDANVQFNADKRYVEFLFNKNVGTDLKQTEKQSAGKEVPKVFRDKELTGEQYNKLKAGETVYIDGLVDKQEKLYQGYITYNKDTGKVDFSFKNPDKLKEQIQNPPKTAELKENESGQQSKKSETPKQQPKPKTGRARKI